MKADIDDGTDGQEQTTLRPLGLLRTEHDGYCGEIGVDRLHGRLTPSVQQILGRLAVYGGQMSEADAKTITGASDAELKDALMALNQSVLIYGDWMQAASTGSVYGGLRRWLAVSPRMSASDRYEAHRAAADYLVKLYGRQDKSGYQPTNLNRLFQARQQYLEADEFVQARKVTRQLSNSAPTR